MNGSDRYTYRNNTLKLGERTLPLPVFAGSDYRLSMRVAFSLLLHYFDGEPNCEAKAYALHNVLGRMISSVTDGWSLSQADLSELVTHILTLAHPEHERVRVEIVAAERRDQIRELCRLNSRN
jgi:hypothetical protein